MDVVHKFYIVRNQEGKFFRAKGYKGGGDSWVDDLGKCRVYNRIGPARSIVTWWTRTYPKFGIPDIVECSITEGNFKVLDETERVNKTIAKINKVEEEREVKLRKYKLEMARKELIDAEQRLKSLRKQR